MYILAYGFLILSIIGITIGSHLFITVVTFFNCKKLHNIIAIIISILYLIMNITLFMYSIFIIKYKL